MNAIKVVVRKFQRRWLAKSHLVGKVDLVQSSFHGTLILGVAVSFFKLWKGEVCGLRLAESREPSGRHYTHFSKSPPAVHSGLAGSFLRWNPGHLPSPAISARCGWGSPRHPLLSVSPTRLWLLLLLLDSGKYFLWVRIWLPQQLPQQDRSSLEI